MEVQLVHKKKWFYRVVAKNGQTILTSETYYTKWNAKRAALSIVRANGFKYKEV